MNSAPPSVAWFTAGDREHAGAIAARACALAADILRDGFAARAARAPQAGRPSAGDAGQQTLHKGAIDLVTETDLRCEAAVRDFLSRETQWPILGEEDGLSGDDHGGPMWVVDPLDGTTNFAHGHPHFSCSVGVSVAGVPVAGAIVDPMRRETYVAGDGASRNGAPLLAPSDPPLCDALLATGFPYDRRTNPDNNVDHFGALVTTCRGVRRAGSAALDLAWVADGRLNGYWELRLKPWDVVAGIALARAAGVVVSSGSGSPWRFDSDALVAAPPNLHGALVAALHRPQESS